jgi:hypothetical protein
VSEYQLQKQSREFNNNSIRRKQKKPFEGATQMRMGPEVSTA